MYKVIKSFKGSPNGFDVVEFLAGTTVSEAELPADLAKVAIREKWVEKPKGAKSEAAEAKAAIKALQDEIGALQNALAEASEADSSTIAAQIEAKQAKLRELAEE